MTSGVTAQIDLGALTHNLQRVRQAAPNSKVMAVIKANAYGHGMIRIAEALSDADAFAVARMEEAMQLRDAGISKTIVVLEGFQDQAELQQAVSNQIQVVVYHEFQIKLLETTSTPAALTVWLKIDSGMHRLGIAPEQVADSWQRLNTCDSVESVRLMTHLASADERSSDQTSQQLTSFAESTEGLTAEKSIANSAAILGWPESHTEWVRPGIMLYGVSPFEDSKGEDDGLKPVMTLRSHLIAINNYQKGDAIGYGGSWQCPEVMPIGVIACGYGDGYPRHAVPGTPVLINGKRHPIVGRVSMDTICVDLRGQPNAKVGDSVILWGQGLPVEEIAEQAGTIAYELLCSVTQRVKC